MIELKLALWNANGLAQHKLEVHQSAFLMEIGQEATKIKQICLQSI